MSKSPVGVYIYKQILKQQQWNFCENKFAEAPKLYDDCQCQQQPGDHLVLLWLLGLALWQGKVPLCSYRQV